MQSESEPLPLPGPHVIYRALPDGGVLLSTTDEVYFGLNVVAARVWELLPPATRTVGELCARLAAEHPDVPAATIADDVRELLEDLGRNALVVNAESRRHTNEMAASRETSGRVAARRAG